MCLDTVLHQETIEPIYIKTEEQMCQGGLGLTACCMQHFDFSLIELHSRMQMRMMFHSVHVLLFLCGSYSSRFHIQICSLIPR